MTGIDAFARLIPAEHGLCVVSTSRSDGTIQSSVVNAGVLDHPVTRLPGCQLTAGAHASAGSGQPSRATSSLSARRSARWG
jgi:hypothetical protein